MDHFEEILTPSQFNEILLSFRSKRDTTFRINTLKSTRKNILKLLQQNSIKIKKSSILDNAYIYNGNEKSLLKTDLVKNGLIYLQSISSMIPPLILNPRENEKVLDIAAAPGSKTSQIAAMMNNTGIIDAVEPDYIRFERLKYNMKLLGVNNINFFNSYGQNIYKNKSGYYDKVLADVPCSGEGRFNIYDKKSYGTWKKKNISKFVNLQKKILKSAVLSAKINGIIVYSTCTINIFENEEIIDFMFNNEKFKIEILSINNNLKKINESINSIPEYHEKKYNKNINKSLRLIPSKRIEGFYVCKIKRIK